MTSWQFSPDRWIGEGHPCFVIAEIGQNHQGDVSICKQMIKAAFDAGADAVKLQKSTIEERYNQKCLERPYKTPNSWGDTYGEHKRYLEFSRESYLELQRYAEKEVGIPFSASAFDFGAVDFLTDLKVPFFKVPSPDTGNLRFIDFMAEKRVPMFISSGMQDITTMRQVYATAKKHHRKFAILQCTSSYPVNPADVNLNVITSYKKEFPDIPIGYSGHESGISISLAAVAMGAKVLERHVTLDKTWRGSDHSASLDMNELKTMITEIRRIESAFGNPVKQMLPGEESFKRKLGKSIVTKRPLAKGHVIEEGDIMVKNAEPVGIPPHLFDKVIGSSLTQAYPEDETIAPNDVVYQDTSIVKKKFVGLILARGGSKSIPKKNTKECAGKPLIAWTLLAMQKADVFDELWVSSDSNEIGEVAMQYGAKFHKRAFYAARDEASSAEAYVEFINKHPDVWAVGGFQCTVPTQDPDAMIQAYNMIVTDKYDCVFSVSRSFKFRWTRIDQEGQVTAPLNFDPAKRPRRQDWKGELVESGAFYFFKRDVAEKTGHYQAGRVGYIVDNYEDLIDIDYPEDFRRCEMQVQEWAARLGIGETVKS